MPNASQSTEPPRSPLAGEGKRFLSVQFDQSVPENENKSSYYRIYGRSPILMSRKFDPEQPTKDSPTSDLQGQVSPAVQNQVTSCHTPETSGLALSAAGATQRNTSNIEPTVETPLPKQESNSNNKMEVGLASYTQGRPVATGSPDRGARGPPRANLHVEFAQVGEMKERKEKYLTAKYGAHQMSLIRKRLGVEMWMYDQLQMLYQSTIKDGKSEEKEIDLDELLDIEDDPGKRKYLQKELSDCKQSSDKVETFTKELLERAKTL